MSLDQRKTQQVSTYGRLNTLHTPGARIAVPPPSLDEAGHSHGRMVRLDIKAHLSGALQKR